MTQPVVVLRDVTKTYPGSPPVNALQGVSLDIRQGELVVVLGPSGSGKSTLLHLMGTLDRPTTGTVEVAGVDTATLDDASLSALRAWNIGFVFQQFFLIENQTTVDNVADGLLYRGTPAAERRRLAVEALERVGLGHRLDAAASKLSGGERQRVAIARAVVGRPALVLADEPTGNLDTATGESIVALLEELHRAGTTIVVITHEPDVAAHFPRRIRTRDGRVEVDESVEVAAP